MEQHTYTHDSSRAVTPFQAGVLLECLAQPNTPLYVSQNVWDLRGKLDIVGLRSAWDLVVAKHDALRTSFCCDEHGNRAHVHANVTTEWLVVDLSQRPDTLREAEWAECVERDWRLGLAIGIAPMMRFTLAQMDERYHRLIWTYHHAILDGWSVGILIDAVRAAYDGNHAEATMKLAVANARGATHLQDDDSGTAAEEFWRSTLAGVRAAQGPWRLSEASGRIDAVRATLSSELSNAIRILARVKRTTPNVVLQVAWSIVLSQLSGESDIVVGVALANRESNLDVVGNIMNTLPLRLEVAKATSIDELLRQAHIRMVDLQRFSHTSLSDVQRWSGITWPGRLFDVVYGFEGYPVGAREQTWKNLEVTRRSTRIANGFAVSAVAVPRRELELRIDYDPARVSRAEASALMARWESTVYKAAVDKSATAGQAMRATARERSVALNHAGTLGAPRLRSLVEEWVRQTSETPDAIAVCAGDDLISYAHARARVRRVARRLRDAGVVEDVCVGVCMDRTADYILSILGIVEAGAAYVPIDPTWPRERRAQAIEDTAAIAVLTSRVHRQAVPAGFFDVITIEDIWASDMDVATAKHTVKGSVDAIANVMFTSGSTGRPKGVVVTHGGILRLAEEPMWRKSSSTHRILQCASLSFDASTLEIWPTLLNGGCVVIYPERVPVPEEMRSCIERGQINTMWLTASLYNAMIDIDPQVLAGVERLMIGGEALSPRHVRVGLESLPTTQFINGYGPTENTVFTCCYVIPRAGSDGDAPIPIGRPITDTQVFVLDEMYEPVPVGMVGELCTAGGGLARGYMNEPRGTASRFVPNPYGPSGSRMYRTGDMARWREDGVMEFMGRRDSQIKLRGYRIELGEIEAVLRTHADVRDAVVCLHEGSSGQKQIVAYVIGPSEQPDARLRDYLHARLPEHMIPSVFVPISQFPLTPNGKLDRAALPPPPNSELVLDSGITEETAVEKMLCGVMCRVLRIDACAPTDNFFGRGGDSIRGIQVRAEANSLGIDFTLQQLFRATTIRALASEARYFESAVQDQSYTAFQLVNSNDRKLVPREAVDAFPLSQLQAGMLFHTDLNPDAALYHDVFGYRVSGRVDLSAMKRAIATVIERHQMLRTSFDLTSFSEPLQIVWPDTEVSIETADWTGLNKEQQNLRLDAWLEREKSRGFETGMPPIRTAIHLLAPEQCELWLSFHHALLDGWSLGVILVELFQEYCGKANALRREASYGAFVTEEREMMRSTEAAAFWQRMLTGCHHESEGLAGASEGLTRSSKVGRWKQPVARHVVAALQDIADASGVPLKTVLLAAHQRVRGLATGTRRVVSGLVTNGRPERTGGDTMVGLFLNTVPFRTDIGCKTWLELIADVFENETALVPYRAYPLSRIQASFGRAFNVIFQFTNFYVYAPLRDIEEVTMRIDRGYEHTNFELAVLFDVDAATGELTLRLNYSPDAMSHDEIAEMGALYLRALDHLSTEPQSYASNETLLGNIQGADRRGVGGDSEKHRERKDSVYSAWMTVADGTPDRIACVEPEGSVSYAEARARAHAVAHILVEAGVKYGDVVGVHVPNGADAIVAMLGVLEAGAAYLPMSIEEPVGRYREAILRLGVSAVIASHVEHWAGVNAISVDAVRSRCDEKVSALIEVPSDGELLTNVMMTSGTTGAPKAIGITNYGVLRIAEWARANLGVERSVLAASSLSFDASTLEIWPTLLNGGCVVIYPERVPVPEEMRSCIERGQINTMWLTASLYNAMIDIDPQVLAGVERLMIGGEALSPRHVRVGLESLPTTQFINGYGPTENTVFTCCYVIPRAGSDGDAPIPIGRPITDTQVFVLDEMYEPVPVGMVGELCTAGGGLARGYMNEPRGTASRFVPNPYGPSGSRMYRTGDMARWREDGVMEFMGRRDSQIKLRGYRIELGEIEAVLRTHADVRDAVVCLHEGSSGQKQIVAYVIGPSEQPDARLRDYLHARLPEHMIPSVFVPISQFPLTPNGKLDRAALPPPPNSVPSKLLEARLESELEQLIGLAWASVLGQMPASRDLNFFEAGGDSLSASRLTARLRALSLECPLRLIFDRPTIAELAEVLSCAPYVSSVSMSGSQAEARSVTQSSANCQVIGLYARGTVSLPAVDTMLSRIASVLGWTDVRVRTRPALPAIRGETPANVGQYSDRLTHAFQDLAHCADEELSDPLVDCQLQHVDDTDAQLLAIVLRGPVAGETRRYLIDSVLSSSGELPGAWGQTPIADAGSALLISARDFEGPAGPEARHGQLHMAGDLLLRMAELCQQWMITPYMLLAGCWYLATTVMQGPKWFGLSRTVKTVPFAHGAYVEAIQIATLEVASDTLAQTMFDTIRRLVLGTRTSGRAILSEGPLERDMWLLSHESHSNAKGIVADAMWYEMPIPRYAARHTHEVIFRRYSTSWVLSTLCSDHTTANAYVVECHAILDRITSPRSDQRPLRVGDLSAHTM